MELLKKYLLVEKYDGEAVEEGIQTVAEKTEEFFWKMMDKEFPILKGHSGSGKDEDILINAIKRTANAFITKNNK